MSIADPVALGLRDRALFALADYEQTERNYLVECAERSCRELLSIDIGHVNEISIADGSVIFECDDLRLRAITKDVEEKVGKQKCVTQQTLLYAWHCSAWQRVNDLAGLGRIVRAMDELNGA